MVDDAIGSSSSSDESGGGDSADDDSEDATAPFPGGLRRLTRDQVENAYRHVLLHPDLALGDRLPLDPSTDEDFRFDTERVALAPFGASDVGKFDTVALAVVDEVFGLPSDTLLDCDPISADDTCSRDYIEGMLSRAFRRPPTTDEIAEYVAVAVQTQADLGDPIQGLEFATATALQSPWFLYLPELGEGDGERRPLTDHELASRLSFFLHNAPPDLELRALADEGDLSDEDTLRAQTRRLLGEDPGRDAMKRFFTQWFGYGGIELLPKNSGVFPDFSPTLAAGMRTELDRAVLSVIDGDPYTSLFTSDQTWLTPDLARFYGVEIPGIDTHEEVLHHFEAEDEGAGCNTDAVPPEFHNLCSATARLAYVVTSTDAAASHSVVVRAYATQGGDEPTRLRLTIDGNATEHEIDATVDAPQTYTFAVDLEPGDHDVVLELANDFYEPPENRDVMIDWVELHASASDPDEVFEAKLPSQRAGILTRAGLLSVYAKPIDTSPTTRGLFVRQRLLCEIIPDPPPGVDTELPPTSADAATNRERVARHKEDPTCAACHNFIDPLGLAMEHFDGIGKFREDQDGTPLDVTGNLDGADFDGAVELGSLLANDARIPRCAAKQLSRFALGQEEESEQEPLLEELGDVLETTSSLPATVEALVLSDLFRTVGPQREED